MSISIRTFLKISIWEFFRILISIKYRINKDLALAYQTSLFLMQNELEEIVRVTACKKPCSYSEYKLMNTNPREFVVAEMPKDQSCKMSEIW